MHTGDSPSLRSCHLSQEENNIHRSAALRSEPGQSVIVFNRKVICFFLLCNSITFRCSGLWGTSELHLGTYFIFSKRTILHDPKRFSFDTTCWNSAALTSMCSCSESPAPASAHFPTFLGLNENKKERKESIPRSNRSVCTLSNDGCFERACIRLFFYRLFFFFFFIANSVANLT